MIILEENFKWHLEAFASELFKWRHGGVVVAVSSPWFVNHK